MESRTTSVNIAGVVLAAGRSSRMRGKNKLLVPVDGIAAIARVCAVALRTDLSPVVVVLGHERRKVREAIENACGTDCSRLRFVFNPRYSEGRLSSVAAALGELPDGCGAAMFLRGDQPWIQGSLVCRLIEAYGAGEHPLAFPVYAGRKGSPTIVGSKLFDRLLALEGDSGTLELALEYWNSAKKLQVDDSRCVRGIDTPEDLREFGC